MTNASMNGAADGDAAVGRECTASLVVCTRDRPELLARALSALRAALAGRPDVEIVVVDSASRTDSVPQLAAAAAARYIRCDVPGLSIARNAGLAAARGAIVVYTDDDCRLEAGFLEPLLAPFARPEVAATAGRLVEGGIAADRGPDATQPVALQLKALQLKALRRPMQGLDAGHGALMAFRPAALARIGGFDPMLGAGRSFGGAEDLDVFCRLLRAGHTVVRVPAAVVTHENRRDDADYVELNERYGLGVGAMCAKWLRFDRAAGIRLTALTARRGLARAVRRARSARTRRGQAAYLAGWWRGLRAARRIPVSGTAFVDEHPPAPVAAAAARIGEGVS